MCLSVDAILFSIGFGSLIDPCFENLHCGVCKIRPAPRHSISERRACGEFPYDHAGVGFAEDKSGTVNASLQELGDRLNIESTVPTMASVAPVVHEKRHDLVLERDVLGWRWGIRFHRIAPFVRATHEESGSDDHADDHSQIQISQAAPPV